MFLLSTGLSFLASSAAWSSAALALAGSGTATNQTVRALQDALVRSPGLVQLTGRDLRVGQTRFDVAELADPSPPYETKDGRLRIYGTGNSFLEYPSWDALLAGENGQRIPLELFDVDGTRIEGQQAVWDVLVHRWPAALGGEMEVLYGGAMTPTGGRKRARWPEDNWNRRIYAFRLVDGRWTRDPLPLFGGVPKSGWLGHCYGHQFETDDKGRTWVFYEKVVEEARDESGAAVPFRTEIFARRMETPFRAADTEVRLLGAGDPPWPATLRTHPVTGHYNGTLVEGPRPVRVAVDGQTFYLLGFSAGDFPTDHYGLNLAWSRELTGPYTPILNETGTDLLDLGSGIKRTLGLSWGPARPAFFVAPSGELHVLFHAVSKAIRPDNDYRNWPRDSLGHFYRSLFLAPVHLAVDARGTPVAALEISP